MQVYIKKQTFFCQKVSLSQNDFDQINVEITYQLMFIMAYIWNIASGVNPDACLG
jgi:hypothetical protein